MSTSASDLKGVFVSFSANPRNDVRLKHSLNNTHASYLYLFLSAYMIYIKGDANHKSHYLYENLPVKSKMAFLSRILILLAILLYEQYIHHTQASIFHKTQFLSAQ